VKSRPGDGRPGDFHRVQDGDGSEGSGSADLDDDLPETGRGLTRRELEGNGSAGEFRRESQLPALLFVVHLDDDAVGVVIQRFAPVGPFPPEGDDRGRVGTAP